MHQISLSNGILNVTFKNTMAFIITVAIMLSFFGIAITSQRDRLFWNNINFSVDIASKNKTLPDAIVFGIRKCGTRAVLEFLNIHPDIVVADTEIHYFDRNLDKGLNWYINKMPQKTSNQQIAIEKTPAYFITPAAPKILKSLNKNTKLILIVKDPITRAISDYAQVTARRKSLNESIYRFEDLVMHTDGQTINVNYKPLWISVYHYHLNNWLEYFKLQDIHIVDGEQFIKEPYAELKKVEQFLGLKPLLTKDKFYFNKTKGFYCAISNGRDICLGESKGRKHPNVDSRVIKKLVDFYRPHNSLFFNMIGRTFPWMGMDETGS